MAVTPSGTISLGDINTALGRSSTASISMSDAQIYLLAGTATSGTINMNSIRDKTTFNGTITIGTYVDKANFYGYSEPSTFNFGAITGTFYGSTIDSFYSYDGSPEQLLSINSPGGIPTSPAFPMYRIRIGTGPVVDTWQGQNAYYLFDAYASPPNFTAADVGLTKNWQVVKS